MSENKSLCLTELCKLAEVHKSSFYYWKKNGYNQALKDEDDLEIIRAIFEKSRAKAGIRTIVMEAQREFGVRINPKKVARIKKEYGLITRIRKKRPIRYGLDKIFSHAKKKNILDRKFAPKRTDKVYCTDITVLHYGQGRKAYLSAMKDLCSREIVSYKVSPTADLSLSTEVARSAIAKLSLKQKKKLMIHSDQGSHYTSPYYQNILKGAGVKQSMSRRGNCLDNAPIESFFGHFKDELDLSECSNFEILKNRVDKYIDYYNNERPQWTLKKKSPAECRGSLGGF